MSNNELNVLVCYLSSTLLWFCLGYLYNEIKFGKDLFHSYIDNLWNALLVAVLMLIPSFILSIFLIIYYNYL